MLQIEGRDNQTRATVLQPNGTFKHYENLVKVEFNLFIVQNKLFGLINEQGTEICKPVFDQVKIYDYNFIAVSSKQKWGAVNRKGEWVINLTNEEILYDRGIAMIKLNGKWGAVNVNAPEKWIIDQKYDGIWLIDGRMIAVQSVGVTILMDYEGNVITK